MDKIVPIEEWIDSYYYSGATSKYLYLFWKNQLVDICDNKKSITEIILTGSIGGGKTYFANVLMMRKLYELAMLGNTMWDYLGLARGSAIFFIYFSISLKQSKFTGFQELVNMIDTTPFFIERFKRDKDIESYLKFPNRVHVITGSKFQHQIGMNVLGSILDEANFRLEKDTFRSAFELYTTILERRLSRFVMGSQDMGLSMLISSALDESSFVETRIKKVTGRDNVKIIHVTGIDVKRDMGIIDNSEDDFVVFVGEGNIMPMVINTWKDFEEIMTVTARPIKDEWKGKKLIEVVKEEEDLRKVFRVVPIAFKDIFTTNIVMAVRDVLGLSIGNDNKLMKSPQAYEDAIDGENIFNREIVQLSMYDNIRLQDYFNLSKVKDKHKQRFIHCDLALGRHDRAGIACSYIEDVKKDDLDRVLPIVRVEWMIGIEKSVNYRMDDEIPLWKIREFLLWLRDKGMNIVKVSFDSFQSADMIQLLQRAGLGVEKLSVDVSDEQYLNLIQLYLERRIKHCDHSIYKRELFNLEWYREKRKVDHPDSSSKDISDGACGSVWNAISNFDISTIRMEEFISYNDTKEMSEMDVYDMLLQEAKKNRKGGWKRCIVQSNEFIRYRMRTD